MIQKRESRFVAHNCIKCGVEFKAYICHARRFCSMKCAIAYGVRGRHKQSRTRLHEIWCHMKTRCFCKTSNAYMYYGGRGISVCDEWANSFEAFRDWAVANGYTEALELDRVSVNGNYEPGNCRWATRRQQMANTRKRIDGITSPFKGVSFYKHAKVRRWRAQISINGVNTYVGTYVYQLEAALAYDDAAYKLRGEYAYLNFPERKRGKSLGIEGVRKPGAGATGNGLSRPIVLDGGEHCTSSDLTEVSHFNSEQKT